MMFSYLKRLCRIARHKGKALGMREEHTLQRHDDGSYTMTIRMIPQTPGSEVGGVDGVVVYATRGIVRHHA